MLHDSSETAALTPSQLSRYRRHLSLPQVGFGGQEKLAATRILIIGLGGLGCPAALYLSAAGVGTLGLADFDKVEEHNLQRQILHRSDGIGVSKIDSARDSLEALNPHLNLREHAEGITPENAVSTFSSYDIIIDGSDNFPTRYLVNDAAFFAGKPLISGSVFQFEGQVSLFHPRGGGPCYRCLFPKMPLPGSVPNCEEAGVLGALCGTVGSLQAMEAIKCAIGIGRSLQSRLLVVDLFSMDFRILNLKKDPQCPLCGSAPMIDQIEAGNYDFTCGRDLPNKAPEDKSWEIEVEKAQAWLDSENPPILLDVREPFEVAICRLEGSVVIPLSQVSEQLSTLPKERPILVYCHYGGRSLAATKFLRAQGYPSVFSMVGGIDAWAEKFDPQMTRY